MMRLVRGLVTFSLLLATAAAAGFLWFISPLGLKLAPDRRTDAIVVLTGGSDRIESGLALLARGKAAKLFVSGVHPGVEVADLVHRAAIDPRLVACCVVLGHAAGNTPGNAFETAQWLSAERYHSLRLVTADYHIRRALLEFQRALPPGTLVIPDPVPASASADARHSWRHAARIVATEYLKYLTALALPGFDRAEGQPSAEGQE